MTGGAVRKVIVLGGGSAGFMAAMALRRRLPMLDVLVIRSRDIGVIGVGEGSTVALTKFLHAYLRVPLKTFHDLARPTWKMGLHFLWGPRPYFHYTFGPGMDERVDGLPRNKGYYCDDSVEYADPHSAMMTHDRIFDRAPGGGVKFHDAISYHFENERFVEFLERHATGALGVRTLDDTVVEVLRDPAGGGVGGLRLKGGSTESADLYVDCSGFASALLGKALDEPFVDFKSSLFCDRAVVGGWARGPDEPIRPYTTCETMDAGWSWQIEHEHRVNRGYVYSSAFVTDDAAEAEFRAASPNVTSTRVVRFASGRYARSWVGNVVAIGNASGFVEPLEATALGVIATQARQLADTLSDADLRPAPTQAACYNDYHARQWDAIRGFIAMHYRFNARRDTPFWRACRADADLGRAAPVVDYFRENGPSNLWAGTLLDSFDPFQMAGYTALLVGMAVPYARRHAPADAERAAWDARRRATRDAALRAMTVREALDVIRSPRWRWAE